MKQDANRCKVHQGNNLHNCRKAKGMTLEALASKVGISVEEAFHLEASPVINDQLLEKLAAILNVSIEKLKEAEQDMPFYETTTNYLNNFTNNSVVNGVNEPGGSHWEDMSFSSNPIIHPIDKISELYERMLSITQSELEKTKSELEQSRKKIKELEQKLSEPGKK